jgi:hypothetical protein
VSFSTCKSSAEIGRTLDGKIAEHFASRDDVGMMLQLGLLPLRRSNGTSSAILA